MYFVTRRVTKSFLVARKRDTLLQLQITDNGFINFLCRIQVDLYCFLTQPEPFSLICNLLCSVPHRSPIHICLPSLSIATFPRCGLMQIRPDLAKAMTISRKAELIELN